MLKQNNIVRDMSNFKMEKFLDHLTIKLNDCFENNCYLANKLFDNFVSTFAEMVDLFVPMKKST